MNRQGYHVSVSPVSKGKDDSVIAKSAYNSGSELVDKKTNKIHDYRSKSAEKVIKLKDKDGKETKKTIEKNVTYSVLILPKKASAVKVEREQFWNDIELIEKSKKAQLGVEIDVMFPNGLNENQRIELVEKYSQTLADRYNVLVDLNIHKPHTHTQKKDGQILEITKDNHHAHILLSSREILANDDNSYSLSKRKNWSLWATSERLSKGLNGRGDELNYQRSLWADLANEMLPKNLNITDKSYREQGVNQLPKMKLGKSLYKDILKGKKSVINEYNETIDDLNKYITENDLEINYNDQGRIDDEVNIQEFKGIKVAYKKRKPFASIDLNKIAFRVPVNELQKEQDDANILDSFMSLADDIETKKKTERSALLSTINTLQDVLSDQAKKVITLNKIYQTLPQKLAELGVDRADDIKIIKGGISSIRTYDENEAIKQSVELLEKFRQDDTQQTTQSVLELKNHLSSISEQSKKNELILNKVVPINNDLLAKFEELEALNKPYQKLLIKAAKELEKINYSLIEKENKGEEWHERFNDLVDIKVTDNIDTYNKFMKLADYDVESIKNIEQEYKELKQIKAEKISDKTRQQLDDLLTSISSYKETTDKELKALKEQVNTASKTYQRLEPSYTKRQKLLDAQEPVIEQDDDLYNEILTTKTTQLNPAKIDEWQRRTDVLQARLIKEQEQAALQKQVDDRRQAQLRQQAEQQLQEQKKAEQVKAYKDRFNAFAERVDKVINELDFKSISAPKQLIDSAEKLVATAMNLDALQRVENITELQQDSKQADLKDTEKSAKNDVKNFIDELNKLTDNKQKIEVIEQLNAKFDEVVKLQSKNETIKEILPQLEQTQKTAQQRLDRANSYSSPRP